MLQITSLTPVNVEVHDSIVASRIPVANLYQKPSLQCQTCPAFRKSISCIPVDLIADVVVKMRADSLSLPHWKSMPGNWKVDCMSFEHPWSQTSCARIIERVPNMWGAVHFPKMQHWGSISCWESYWQLFRQHFCRQVSPSSLLAHRFRVGWHLSGQTSRTWHFNHILRNLVMWLFKFFLEGFTLCLDGQE